MTTESNLENTADHNNQCDQSIAVLIIGMAGSGKTTLVNKLNDFLKKSQKNCFTVNLDPAVYDNRSYADIDIRETINYAQIKEMYSLGPNGAITTSLNLFTIKFNQVMDKIAQKTSTHKYITFDTPGQIEAFTWSASGTIISETLASSMATVILYVMDAQRCTNIKSFMINMLYACTVSIKYNAPFIAVFNKSDIGDCTKLKAWMSDFEQVSNEFQGEESSRLHYSLFLRLEDLYCDLKTVSVSSTNGDGFDELLKAIDDARDEYNREFKPLYEKFPNNSNKTIATLTQQLNKLGFHENTEVLTGTRSDQSKNSHSES